MMSGQQPEQAQSSDTQLNDHINDSHSAENANKTKTLPKTAINALQRDPTLKPMQIKHSPQFKRILRNLEHDKPRKLAGIKLFPLSAHSKASPNGLLYFRRSTGEIGITQGTPKESNFRPIHKRTGLFTYHAQGIVTDSCQMLAYVDEPLSCFDMSGREIKIPFETFESMFETQFKDDEDERCGWPGDFVEDVLLSAENMYLKGKKLGLFKMPLNSIDKKAPDFEHIVKSSVSYLCVERNIISYCSENVVHVMNDDLRSEWTLEESGTEVTLFRYFVANKIRFAVLGDSIVKIRDFDVDKFAWEDKISKLGYHTGEKIGRHRFCFNCKEVLAIDEGDTFLVIDLQNKFFQRCQSGFLRKMTKSWGDSVFCDENDILYVTKDDDTYIFD